MKTCWIFGALEVRESCFNVNENDLVIAADAGLNTLKQKNITPDLIVGDFDSLGMKPEGDNVIAHPVRKDDTDTLLALKLGLSKGYRSFIIYGGLGGKLDHTLANIQTASFAAENGANAVFIADDTFLTVIKNSSISFSEKCEGRISVFAIGGTSSGVTEKGLLYELNDTDISPDFPVGVSNEFTGKKAFISVSDGKLCVIWNGKNNSYSIGGNNEGQ